MVPANALYSLPLLLLKRPEEPSDFPGRTPPALLQMTKILMTGV